MKVDWHSYLLTLSTLIDENYKSTQPQDFNEKNNSRPV